MLSEYIKKGDAYFTNQMRKLSLQHTDRTLQINYLSPQYRKITALTLNYCHLRSLKGIQQFEQLEEISLKFNDITEVAELYRIKNKEAVSKLQFVGNQIEYLGAALFINLVKTFPNLIELNGRNYLSVIYHRDGKNHSMRKLLRQSSAIQKEMIKTVKRQKARNEAARKTYNREIQVQRQTRKYILQEETNQQEMFQSRQKYRQTHAPVEENRRTSKKQYQCSQSSQSDYYDQSGLKENRNFNNISHHERDVSLGALSNIPMTKSVRPSVISNSQPKNAHKNKGLEIFVLNESLNSHTNHNHYAQPTATFAMQRQKQNLGFDFKEKKQSKYQDYSIPIEEYQGDENCELKPTKRQTYGSIDSEDEDSINFQDSQIEINLISNPILRNQRQTLRMARHYYEKQLESRVFMAIRNVPKKKNLPMRLTFQ